MKRILTLVMVAAGCSRQEPRPEPTAAASAPSDPLDEDWRFDLVDMLPKTAGGLSMVGATAFKGRGGFHIEPPKQQAVGYYQWVQDEDGKATVSVTPELAYRAATVKCFRNDPSATDFGCSDKGNKKVKVAGLDGCFQPAERDCKDSIGGAAISWPGCTIDFKCEAWGKRKAADAIAVATAVERWARRYRGDKNAIPADEVRANRQALIAAIRRGD